MPLLTSICISRAAAVVAVLVTLVAPTSGDAQDARLLIASTVYTMEGDPLQPGQVLIVDGKIRAVGKKVDVGNLTPEIIDLGENSVLMPGLVDAASQAPVVSGGSDEITREITPDFQIIDSVDWKQDAVRRQRQAGTTTMCVIPGTENVFGGTAAIVKTSDSGTSVLDDDYGLVAMVCSDPSSRNRSRTRPDSIYVRQPTNRMGVVWILRKTFDRAAREGDNGELDKIRQTMQGERPLMMVSRLGHDLTTVLTLADEFKLQPIVVGGQEAYKVREELVEKNIPVILQSLTVGGIRGAEGSEVCWNVAGVLHKAGATFALSGNDLLEQARFAHRYGLPGPQSLEAITSMPAKILKIDDRVGSLAPGKDADLVALDGDPLDFTSSVRWVMVNGNIIDE